MKIELYGITLPNARCPACHAAIKLIQSGELGDSIEFVFHPVLTPADNEVGFEYNIPKIDEYLARIGKPGNRRVRYPQIFVDGVHIGGLAALKQHFDIVD